MTITPLSPSCSDPRHTRQAMVTLVSTGVASVYYKTWLTLWVDSGSNPANGTVVTGWSGGTSYYLAVYAALAMAMVSCILVLMCCMRACVWMCVCMCVHVHVLIYISTHE